MSCKSIQSLRTVLRNFKAREFTEGAGFIVRRPLGGGEMSTAETDPFLMLDEVGPVNFKKGEFKGAPWHPHRGQDTVMYMKAGRGDHQDSLGNKGTLLAGDVQWMTAGSGIIHDEGLNHPGGDLHGFQMWINLPRKNKMDDPAYRTIKASKITKFESDDGKVLANVIAGQVGDAKSPCQPKAQVQYIDFILKPNATYVHQIPKGMETCIVYVYEGDGKFGGDATEAKRSSTLMFSKSGDGLSMKAGDNGLSCLLLAGVPLKEPVVWRGPFVMNTQEEIDQAIRDYQTGNLVRAKAKEQLAKTADETKN